MWTSILNDILGLGCDCFYLGICQDRYLPFFMQSLRFRLGIYAWEVGEGEKSSYSSALLLVMEAEQGEVGNPPSLQLWGLHSGESVWHEGGNGSSGLGGGLQKLSKLPNSSDWDTVYKHCFSHKEDLPGWYLEDTWKIFLLEGVDFHWEKLNGHWYIPSFYLESSDLNFS